MSKRQAPSNFGFGEDEAMLRDLARRFLEENLPVQKLRDLVAGDSDAAYERGERSPWDEGLWKQMVELGWSGLAVPEAQGGVGFSVAGIAGLVEEIGRFAVPSPLVSTLHATFVVRETENAEALLARIAKGEAASLATTPADGSWEGGDSDVHARNDGEGLILDGTAHFIQDAFKTDHFIVSARSDDPSSDGIVLCSVSAGTTGLTLEQDHIHDLTRDQGHLLFEGVAVGANDVLTRQGKAALARSLPARLVTLAADLVGSAEWQLQTTTQYAKDRVQFDRPLGFFQAVKHPLANAMIEIDRAKSLVYHAACEIDEGASDAPQIARMAKSQASDAGAFISDRSVQLHGGIGFTWESDVHLYFKRSLHNQALLGDGAYQRALIADSLIGPIEA